MEYAIDDELCSVLPRLDDGSLELLEYSIKEHGCIYPIVIWKETGLILDGHHRLEICMKNGFDFKIKYISIRDRESAKQWIIDNQIGKRNVSRAGRVRLERKRHWCGVDGLRKIINSRKPPI